MRFVSCRKDFYNAEMLGPLSESIDTGCTLAPYPKPQEGELLLVHGYNNRFGDVVSSYETIYNRAAEVLPDTPVVGFLWPGLGDKFFDHDLFRHAQAQADEAAMWLAEYLKASPAPISIMTHSLGARVALEAIKVAQVPVKNLFLTGPAVDNEHLRTKYADAVKKIARTHVFWSKNDGVLAGAYMLSQFDKALGHSGPDSVIEGVYSHDRGDFVHQHSDYRHDPVLWRTIKGILA